MSIAEQHYGQGLPSRGGEKRRAAASALNMEVGILKRIGDFTSERGSEDTMRKAGGNGIELSTNERNWLEQAIKHLTLRMLRASSSVPTLPLVMADLPPLPSPKP